MGTAYALCPVATAVFVAAGRGHRLAAVVLMFTAFATTHLYVGACGLRALAVAPTRGLTGRLWDDTPIVALLAVPVLVTLAWFTDEPTRTPATTAVAVVLAATLVRSIRNGFEPPQAEPTTPDGDRSPPSS